MRKFKRVKIPGDSIVGSTVDATSTGLASSSEEESTCTSAGAASCRLSRLDTTF